MDIGPRIVFLILIVAIAIGIRDGLWSSFYDTLLAVNAVNLTTKAITGNLEEKIMNLVYKIENYCKDLIWWAGVRLRDTILASLRFVRALCRKKTFPPVLDV